MSILRSSQYFTFAWCFSALFVVAGCKPAKPPAGGSGGSPPAGSAQDPNGQDRLGAASGRYQPTAEEISGLRREIEALSKDYGKRVRARQRLLYALCRLDSSRDVVADFDALIDDVERNEDRAMAQQVAAVESGQAQRAARYDIAVDLFRRMLSRWPDVADRGHIQSHIGECQLSAKRYVDAEKTFREAVERDEGTEDTGWAWRRMALAQTLQSHFDEAIATLDLMAEKFKGTSLSEYAKMRKGYVLGLSGRKAEAKEAYSTFLAENKTSDYHELASTYLKRLDDATRVASVGP